MKNIARILVITLVLQTAVLLTGGFGSAESVSTYISRLNDSDFVFNGTSYRGKKAAMIDIAERLMIEGFEAAFAAGVMANVACEGSFGKFEGINGYTEKRLTEVFPSLKPCSESGKDHQNYVAHMKGFTNYDRCGHDHSEYTQYSAKYIYNGFSLKAIGAMLDRYAAENWNAKFGLGSIQWTAGRTATLFSFYRAAAGNADTITQEQCAEAEMQMIVYELKNKYASVYRNWLNAQNGTESQEAAYDAGYRVCYYYEVPASRATASEKRGNIAKDIYAVMNPACMDHTAPTISNIRMSELDRNGFTLDWDVYDEFGVSEAYVSVMARGDNETWVRKDAALSEDGMHATFRVDAADHNNARDTQYYFYVHAVDANGNDAQGTIAGGFYIDGTVPTISNIIVSDIDDTGFTLDWDVYDAYGIAKAYAAVMARGDNEMWISKDAELNEEGTHATFHVDTADHNNVRDTQYYFYVHAVDTYGNDAKDSIYGGVYIESKPDLENMDVLELPAELTMVEAEAFESVAAEVIIIPAGAEYIAEDAFDSCVNLKYIINYSEAEITAPEGVRIIRGE